MTHPDDKQFDKSDSGFSEQAAPFSAAVDLGPDVDRLLAEAEADFREVRTLTMEDFRAEMRAHLDQMRNRT